MSLQACETSNAEEYDVDEGAIGSIESIEVEQDVASNAENLEVAHEPLGQEAAQPEHYEEVEVLEEEYQVEFKDVQPNKPSSPATGKGDPFNMRTFRSSLDNSGSSDCVETAAYYEVLGTDDNEENLNETDE